MTKRFFMTKLFFLSQNLFLWQNVFFMTKRFYDKTFFMTFADCDTKDGWHSFNLACYKIFGEVKMSWNNARQHCEDLNSILATVHSPDENEFVSSLPTTAAGFTYAWIGASDAVSEGSWVWVDGKSWGGYENWYGNNPNGVDHANCALIYISYGQWDDAPCSLTRPYICKKNA